MTNFWSLDGATRVSRVAELVKSKQSDLSRWSDPQNADGAKDHSRSRFVGKLIPPGSSVMDIGCGAMAFSKYLPEGCSYACADLHERSPDCQVVDLNKGEFPKGKWDCIVFLGVLEYVFDVESVLRNAIQASKKVYVDYSSEHLMEASARRSCGWVSDLTPGGFLDLAIAANTKDVSVIKVVANRYLYICNSG